MVVIAFLKKKRTRKGKKILIIHANKDINGDHCFSGKKVCEKEKKKKSIILSNKDYVYALRVLKK